MPSTDIKVGDTVFLKDGGDPIGAVTNVAPQGRSAITMYVENAGEFSVPLTAVKGVHFAKVIIDARLLDTKLQAAIRHAHDAETRA